MNEIHLIKGIVSKIYKRKSELGDPPVSNINHIIVLVSMTQPKVIFFKLIKI